MHNVSRITGTGGRDVGYGCLFAVGGDDAKGIRYYWDYDGIGNESIYFLAGGLAVGVGGKIQNRHFSNLDFCSFRSVSVCFHRNFALFRGRFSQDHKNVRL